jgi:hypothetical protein
LDEGSLPALRDKGATLAELLARPDDLWTKDLSRLYEIFARRFAAPADRVIPNPTSPAAAKSVEWPPT